MSFESTILGALTGSASVIALVPATSIYFGTGPQDAASPFIVCTRVTTSPTLTTDNGETGAARLDNISLQVTGYCRGYLPAGTLADAIRATLESLRPTVCILTDRRGDYDDDPTLHGQILQFSCWFASSS